MEQKWKDKMKEDREKESIIPTHIKPLESEAESLEIKKVRMLEFDEVSQCFGYHDEGNSFRKVLTLSLYEKNTDKFEAYIES